MSCYNERDSEVAIHIEDTRQQTIKMNGVPFVVGILPHRIRCQLMRQHLGDTLATMSIDDVVSSEFYDFIWRVSASNNATHYSALDKERDIFAATNRSMMKYREALENYENPLRWDVAVQRAVATNDGGIKGTLLPWPMEFLMDEDLQPNLATRAIVPTALWV